MMEEYFTSRFVEKGPYSLRLNYNEALIENLSFLVGKAAQGFKKDFIEIKSAINDLDPKKKFSQQLYAVNLLLLDSLNGNNGAEINKALTSLCFVLENYPYSLSFGIRSINNDPWELEYLESQRMPIQNSQGRFRIDAVDRDSLNKFSPIVIKSLESLKTVSPLFYEEFETYVSEIILFNSDDRITGMTTSKLFGALYLGIPNANIPIEGYFCENIVHETSHLHLGMLFFRDRIILNDPNEKYAAPIRPDPRPMYGIFHATFVLSRMVRIFQKLVVFFGHASYKEHLKILEKQFLNGYTTVKKHARLTPLGLKIVDSYSDLI